MLDFLTYSAWLYTKIYQNHYFFFDLWSLVHCWNGFVLFVLFKSVKIRKPFTKLLLVLLIYEIVEILIPYFVLGIIKPETFKDQFTDIIVGMTGGGIGSVLLNLTSVSNSYHLFRLKLFIVLLASITYSFLWVGFYGYRYNIKFFNSPGINWYAWTAWTTGAAITIYLFDILKIRNLIIKFLSVWIIYLAALFTVETFGYYSIKLHEISMLNPPPLIFGIIHGSPVLHFMYIFSPFFTISIFFALKHLVFKALRQSKKTHYNLRVLHKINLPEHDYPV